MSAHPTPQWPKKPFEWIHDDALYVSIPFTWELPTVRSYVSKPSPLWSKVVVGGPAVKLLPNYFDDVECVTVGAECQGVLQRINPLATRTTLGCVNRCGFCGVPKIEGAFVELEDWPDLPVICDNNLLAASVSHFDKVIDRLIPHGWANFNQGIDARRLTDYHAMRIAEIKEPMVYLALDNIAYKDSWECAYDRLRSAGMVKRNIRSYVIVGYNTDPGESWARCKFVESHGVKAMPQWYHALDQLEHNVVTEAQEALGWNKFERTNIMGWFYKHRGVPR